MLQGLSQIFLRSTATNTKTSDLTLQESGVRPHIGADFASLQSKTSLRSVQQVVREREQRWRKKTLDHGKKSNVQALT